MRLIDADVAIEELTDRSHQAAKRVGTDSPFWEGLVIARRIVEQLADNSAGEGTTSDLISRQEAIDALDCINGTEEVLRSLPPAHPETPCYLGSPCEYQNAGVVVSHPDLAAGEWVVHLYKVGVNRYECDTCHARCDIMYPYCPYCGEKKEGERYVIN